MPNTTVINEGEFAQFNATPSGKSEVKYRYHWRKRGDNLPLKVSGVNEAVLIIPDLSISDEGGYYCIVTNEWKRSVESNTVTLTVKGTYHLDTSLVVSVM